MINVEFLNSFMGAFPCLLSTALHLTWRMNNIEFHKETFLPEIIMDQFARRDASQLTFYQSLWLLPKNKKTITIYTSSLLM